MESRPIAGTSYAATSLSGTQVLFTPDVDTGPLLDDLRATFGDRPFTIEQADARTLETHFESAHLRRRTLKPAEARGEIEVVSSKAGRRTGDFPAGTKLRFTSPS